MNNFTKITHSAVFIRAAYTIHGTTAEERRASNAAAETAGDTKVEDTKGFLILGHPNWTICSLLS